MALTPEEQAELAQLEQQFAAPQSSGLTPEEEAELAALEAAQAPPEMGTGMKVLTGAGKALDYAGGISRAALANAIDAVKPGKEMASYKDLLQALKANPFDSKAPGAPSTAEYLERAGVPAGASLSDDFPGLFNETGDGLALQKGGWADPTLRGLAGFAGDIATDPMTYLTLGASAAKKAAKASEIAARKGVAQAAPSALSKALTSKPATAIARPLDAASEFVGKKIYKSGLKAIDQEAAKFGKAPVSDLLMEKGIAGSAEGIQNQMDELGEALLKERQAVLREASKAGGKVSMREAMEPTLARVQQIRSSKDPALQDLANALEAEANKYLKLDAAPAQDVLRPLYRQGDMVGGQTPIEIVPKKDVIGSLPRQGELVGGQTPIEIIPGKDVIEELPTTSKQRLTEAGYAQAPEKPVTYFDRTPTEIKIGKTVPDEFAPRPEVQYFDQIPADIKIGKTVPDEFVPKDPLIALDTIPATPGVDPLTGTRYKSAVTGSLPQSAYQSDALRGVAKQAEREMGGGLKTAVETSVERATGRGKELQDLNDQLGRVLTTKKKQRIEASKEINKNALTSVDAPLAVLSPRAAVIKKLADYAKMTGPRTNVGKTLYQGTGGKADVISRRMLWEQLLEDEANKASERPQ